MTEYRCEHRSELIKDPIACPCYYVKCLFDKKPCSATEATALLGRVEAALEAYKDADPPIGKAAFAKFIIAIANKVGA